MSTQRNRIPIEGGLRALLHSFRHAMRDIVLGWLAGFALGALVAEVVGAVLTRAWPTLQQSAESWNRLPVTSLGLAGLSPQPACSTFCRFALSVHLTAAAIGLLLGYAAAVTIALRETIHGVLGSIERLVMEIERLGGRITHEVEERAGHAQASGTVGRQMEPDAHTALSLPAHNGHAVPVMVRPMDG